MNLLSADFYELRKSRSLKISVVIVAVGIVLLAWVLFQIAKGRIDTDIMGTLSMLSDAMMVSLVSSLVTGLVICGAFTSKNIHSEIANGSRRLVVVTKMFTNLLITAILILPYAGFAVISFASAIDLADLQGIPSLFINIMTNKANVAVDAPSMGQAILLSGVGILLYMARLSICVPVAFIFRRPVAVIAAGIVSSFGFDMAAKGLEDVPVLGNVLQYTPYAIIYDLDMSSGGAVIVTSILSSVFFIVLMTLITYLFFRKAEVK